MSDQQDSVPMVPRTVGDLIFALSERACERGLTEAEAARSTTHQLGRILRRAPRATRQRLARTTRDH